MTKVMLCCYCSFRNNTSSRLEYTIPRTKIRSILQDLDKFLQEKTANFSQSYNLINVDLW